MRMVISPRGIVREKVTQWVFLVETPLVETLVFCRQDVGEGLLVGQEQFKKKKKFEHLISMICINYDMHGPS